MERITEGLGRCHIGRLCYLPGMGTEAIERWTNDAIIGAAARGELSGAQIHELMERDPKLSVPALIATMQSVAFKSE